MVMRFLSLIFVTLIVFLAVKPGIDLLSKKVVSEQTCCGEQCAPTSNNDNAQNQNNDCSGNTCNPFQVCCSCVLICLTTPFDYLIKPAVLTEKDFFYLSVFRSQFTPDFWQPPKIVWHYFNLMFRTFGAPILFVKQLKILKWNS